MTARHCRAQVLVARLQRPAPDLDALGGRYCCHSARACRRPACTACRRRRPCRAIRACRPRALPPGRTLRRDSPPDGIRARLSNTVLFSSTSAPPPGFLPCHAQLALALSTVWPAYSLTPVSARVRPRFDQIAGARYRTVPGQGSVASHVQGTADKREIAVARKLPPASRSPPCRVIAPRPRLSSCVLPEARRPRPPCHPSTCWRRPGPACLA